VDECKPLVPGVRFSGVEGNVNAASKIVTNDAAKMIAVMAPDKKADGTAALSELKSALEAGAYTLSLFSSTLALSVG
jgi:hypothetical protein